jgi:hypothetical protein
MAGLRFQFAMVFAAAAVSACSFSTDALWPSLTGKDPKAPAATEQNAAQAARAATQVPPAAANATPGVSPPPPPILGTSTFVPPPITPGQPTGTFVGQKVAMLRTELQRMRLQTRQWNGSLQQIRRQTGTHSQAYHSSIAAINSRLQVGTTPGNPFLVQQWNVSQSALAKIDADIARMNSLANSVAGTSTMSSYLLETTRAAYGLSGAVEEDHRQLAILEDEVNRTVVLIDRLLNELSEDINRQTTYVSNERGNLTSLSLAIKNGELLGSSLSNRAFATAAPVASASPAARPTAAQSRPAAVAGRRPLVVIRFDRPNVAYQQALYTAVNKALQRRPQAGFDLVAVAAAKGSPAQVTVASNKAKRSAESVLRSLSEMGLPLQRVRLSAITSAQARNNEVHLYVR